MNSAGTAGERVIDMNSVGTAGGRVIDVQCRYGWGAGD